MTPPRAALDALGLSGACWSEWCRCAVMHAHPELSNQEHATQRYLREALAAELSRRS